MECLSLTKKGEIKMDMMNMNVKVNGELVIKDLLNQIAKLSKEKALYFALATEYKAKLIELEGVKNEHKDSGN